MLQTEDVRRELTQRRERLAVAIGRGDDARLGRLLHEVDDALAQLDHHGALLCRTCGDPIEAELLSADPLVGFCIDHLAASQRRALEHDLEVAAEVQGRLLPPARLVSGPWELARHFQPMRLVSGDYCDVIERGGRRLLALGDVSGKGVAASIVMAHLHATIRSLAAQGLGLAELVSQVNRLLCESTLDQHYATLVVGELHDDGHVELVNAGHQPPLLVSRGAVSELRGAGLPVGLFCSQPYTGVSALLGPDDALVLYTDGVSEATDAGGEEYGDRLAGVLTRHHGLPPAALVERCVADVAAFRGRAPAADDLTIMAVRRLAT